MNSLTADELIATLEQLLEKRSGKMTNDKPEVFEVYRTKQGTLDKVVLYSDYEALQAECLALKAEIVESRANERQAMAYLEAVRGIVGGDSFPEMVGRVKELRVERNGYKLAFEEWLEKSK